MWALRRVHGFIQITGDKLMTNYTTEPIWYTADGRELTVKQMTLGHLTNARECLTRRISSLEEYVDYYVSNYPSFYGDMAQKADEAIWDRNIGNTQNNLDKTRKWIERFNDEIVLRHPKSRAEKNRHLKKDSLHNIKTELYKFAKCADFNSHSDRKWLFRIVARLENLIGDN